MNETRPSSSPIVITDVRPEVDGGRYPIQRCVGDTVIVEADVFTSGNEELSAELLHRRESAREWTRTPLEPVGDDRWRGAFTVAERGRYHYTVAAACEGESTIYEKCLSVRVGPERAGAGAWYQVFPRSCAAEPGRPGALRDVEALLPYVAGMGFDVLHLTPIHPIGRSERRGEAGNPWAVGGPEGGHLDVHPELGTLADFRRLLAEARRQGLDLALEIPLQCSPDHPWVRQHPEWFREHPSLLEPDILPFRGDPAGLREALAGVFEFWIEQGVRIFSVDRPQTRPFPFWEWLLARLRHAHDDVVLVASACTRPKVMRHLARLGFDQLPTPFIEWTTRAELEDALGRLTAEADWYRPSLWPSTADNLPRYLQEGGVAAYEARLVLAATLSPCYGIPGPAYELQAGGEEAAEKLGPRYWQRDREDSLYDFIARINRIRRQNPALRTHGTLRFHATDNENLICYSKRAGGNAVVTVVNLDPRQPQAGWLTLSGESLGRPPGPLSVHDLISDARFTWQGSRHYIALDPGVCPAHVFRIS